MQKDACPCATVTLKDIKYKGKGKFDRPYANIFHDLPIGKVHSFFKLVSLLPCMHTFYHSWAFFQRGNVRLHVNNTGGINMFTLNIVFVPLLVSDLHVSH